MNESGASRGVAPSTETLSGPKKLAVLAALGGVFGFAASYLFSWLTGLWVPTGMGALGMCLGAAIGVGLTRWGDRVDAQL
jgi:hypothetical protein